MTEKQMLKEIKEVDKLKAEIASLRETVKDYESATLEYSSKIQELEGSVSAKDELIAKLTAENSKILDLQESNKQLLQRNVELSKARTDLVSSLDEKRKECNTLLVVVKNLSLALAQRG